MDKSKLCVLLVDEHYYNKNVSAIFEICKHAVEYKDFEKPAKLRRRGQRRNRGYTWSE